VQTFTVVVLDPLVPMALRCEGADRPDGPNVRGDDFDFGGFRLFVFGLNFGLNFGFGFGFGLEEGEEDWRRRSRFDLAVSKLVSSSSSSSMYSSSSSLEEVSFSSSSSSSSSS